MKTIITAIDNLKIFNEIKKNENIKIVGKDLIYKEAVLEILEKNKNIDSIILYEKILGEINFFELIKKIKNINKKTKIIIILKNKNEKLENKLKKINIKNIYLKNKINSKKIIEIINEKNINKNIKNKKIEKNNKNKTKNNKFIKNKNINRKEKIINIKKHIKNSINKFFDSKFLKMKEIKFKNKSKYNKKNKNKTILILGNGKSGKTLVSLLLAQKLENQNNKISIINLSNNTKNRNKHNKLMYIQKEIEDELKKYNNKNSIFKFLKNSKIENKKINNVKNKIGKIKIKLNKNKILKKYKLKINKKNNDRIKKYLKNKKILKRIKKILSKRLNGNINYYSNFNFIKKYEKVIYKNYKEKTIDIISEVIKKIQIESRYTIIEMNSPANTKLSNEIIKNADKIIILIEVNCLGIKGGQQILEKIKKEKNLDKKSLHIVFNKIEKNKISNKILEEIFKDYKTIGNIMFNKISIRNLFNLTLKSKNKVNLRI